MFNAYSAHAQSDDGEVTFAIEAFEIEGNTIMQPEVIEEALQEFTGTRKSAVDVESARDRMKWST